MGGKFSIKTPRGSTFYMSGNGNGSVTARLDWDPGFGQKYEGKFNRKQAYVDKQCIIRMAPETPRRTGALIKSATLGTVIGSGKINQTTDYARRWYYEKANFSGAPNRGNYWFERMKNRHKDSILKGAQKID